MSVPKPDGKPFVISKRLVWEAWLRVKANKGAAGVDEESIAEFESDLKGNLYKLWNRMSSGSYMPPPVRAVEIPKKGGRGVRVLGVPTVADRVAQTVARLYLEPEVEQMFHPDSYGYRPGRSAHDALRVCRGRCWRYDWVVDLDLKSFFDSLDHSLVLRSVAHHTDLRWILLYVQRWLKAPLQREDGTLQSRDRGSPQGSAISPLLANIFLHYALDLWLSREFPDVPFERYADDAILHCRSQQQARVVLGAIVARLAQVGLELNLDKTRIVYCKDSNRHGSHEHERFDSSGTRFVPGAPGIAEATCSSASARPSATTPHRRSATRSNAGGCICGAGRRSATSRGRSTRPCEAGPTTTASSTGQSWTGPSSRSMSTSSDGPCGNTSDCAAIRGERGGFWQASHGASPTSSFTGR